jgi:hypothetical protein
MAGRSLSVCFVWLAGPGGDIEWYAYAFKAI